MAPASYDFLALPKPHHHVSRLLVLVIVLAAVVLIAWLSTYLWGDRQQIETDINHLVQQPRLQGVTLSESDIQRIAATTVATGTKIVDISNKQINSLSKTQARTSEPVVTLTSEQIQAIANTPANH